MKEVIAVEAKRGVRFTLTASSQLLATFSGGLTFFVSRFILEDLLPVQPEAIRGELKRNCQPGCLVTLTGAIDEAMVGRFEKQLRERLTVLGEVFNLPLVETISPLTVKLQTEAAKGPTDDREHGN